MKIKRCWKCGDWIMTVKRTFMGVSVLGIRTNPVDIDLGCAMMFLSRGLLYKDMKGRLNYKLKT